MSKQEEIRKEKKKGLSDKELIEKYEAGSQPVGPMLDKLLDTPNPKSPTRKDKRQS